MTTPDLIAELAEVVRLGIAASNDEPWQVDAEGDIVCNGEQVAWPITNKLDAPYIAALNNLFRTHHANIEANARDAARYRWLRNRSYGQHWHPICVEQQPRWHGAERTGTLYTGPLVDGRLDNAIDAAMHDSAPACWCRACQQPTWTNCHFIVCPTCGNKRCPHANDHRNACTGSNAVGQPGSSWEHVKPITPKDC